MSQGSDVAAAFVTAFVVASVTAPLRAADPALAAALDVDKADKANTASENAARDAAARRARRRTVANESMNTSNIAGLRCVSTERPPPRRSTHV